VTNGRRGDVIVAAVLVTRSLVGEGVGVGIRVGTDGGVVDAFRRCGGLGRSGVGSLTVRTTGSGALRGVSGMSDREQFSSCSF